MKPSSTRLWRGRLTAVVLGLGLLVSAGYFGCGRMPPEGFWEPSPEDSTALTAAVNSLKTMFESAFNEAEMLDCDTVMPGTTFTRLRAEIAENPFKQRFRYDGFQHVFFTDSFDLEFSFIATIDTLAEVTGDDTVWVQETTATVTVVESIPGRFDIHAFSYTKFLHDTLFFPSPGETLVLQLYDSVFTAIDQVVAKTLSGSMSGGAVFKKVAGNWDLWKVSGGTRFYAPNSDDAPYLAFLDLAGPDTTVEITLRPDTNEYGIQRFYAPEELPTFHVGDSIYIPSLATTVLDAANYLYYNGGRHEWSSSDKVCVAGPPGVQRLFIVQIPIEVFFEIDGDRLENSPATSGDYVAVVWGIAINVVE